LGPEGQGPPGGDAGARPPGIVAGFACCRASGAVSCKLRREAL